MAIVVEARDAASAPIVTALSSAAAGKIGSQVHQLRAEDVTDPIRKGQFLAHMHGADLVVTVGNEATVFVLRETEEVPVYFVGADQVSGKYLTSKDVAGIFPYNLGELLDTAAALQPKTLGIAYTPGYKFIAERIRTGAEERGMSVVERKIAGLPEVADAVRDLTDQAQLIWFLGDPLLSRGAGFNFLIERALSRRIPVIGADAWEVRHGAFFCLISSPEDMAARAARSLNAMLDEEGKVEFESPRINFGPEGGTVYVNTSLMKRWNLKMPSSVRWKPIH
jgi:ABC-type uncharacterized transport system substrate-binding protein